MESAINRREQIIVRLRHRRKESIANLVTEFNVSRQTIWRDLMVLSTTYPIVTKSGPGGGVFYYGEQMRNTFNDREVRALTNALQYASEEDKVAINGMLIIYSPPKAFDVDNIFKILKTTMPQVELAQKLGISESALSNIMSKKRKPSKALQEKIEALLGEALIATE